MIVRLIRPEDGGRRWLLYAPGADAGFIDATPELQRAMEGPSGYFHAEPHADGEGWTIGDRAPDQPW